MDFNKPCRFMRFKDGKEQFIDIVPNKLKGWKDVEWVESEPPQAIWVDEEI